MKTAGYWPCRNEIINAHLSTPHKYEPFTELFDVGQLAAIRDKYGADLYRECYADAAHEVMEAANVTTHLHRRVFPWQHNRPAHQRDRPQG